jgi:hypothetical protein
MSEPTSAASRDLDGVPDPHKVANRAEDRPPEESESDDPRVQAQTVLEDSEQRVADGAKDSSPS